MAQEGGSIDVTSTTTEELRKRLEEQPLEPYLPVRSASIGERFGQKETPVEENHVEREGTLYSEEGRSETETIHSAHRNHGIRNCTACCSFRVPGSSN